MTMSILFLGIENWLMLRICGTKRLNPCFRLHKASEAHVLKKDVTLVWFTAAFFVGFIVAVFIPNIEGIQIKVICL